MLSAILPVVKRLSSEPALSWKGPGGSLPMSRYKLDKFDSELTINDIRASDQGDYICTASNARGQNTHRLQLRVEGFFTNLYLVVCHLHRVVNLVV